jgi:hypothetical protein
MAGKKSRMSTDSPFSDLRRQFLWVGVPAEQAAGAWQRLAAWQGEREREQPFNMKKPHVIAAPFCDCHFIYRLERL